MHLQEVISKFLEFQISSSSSPSQKQGIELSGHLSRSSSQTLNSSPLIFAEICGQVWGGSSIICLRPLPLIFVKDNECSKKICN